MLDSEWRPSRGRGVLARHETLTRVLDEGAAIVAVVSGDVLFGLPSAADRPLIVRALADLVHLLTFAELDPDRAWHEARAIAEREEGS